jgi:branched-chain amino acid aminotransferase
MSYVYINDELHHFDQAQIHITDLGLLRGMGIFDYFLVEDNKPRYFDDHINRFAHSLAVMGLEVDVEESRAKILDLIRRNNHGNSSLKIVVTGGYADDEFTMTRPNIIIINRPFTFKELPEHTTGARLITCNYQRELSDAKTTNYLQAVRMQKKVKENGAAEVLYIDNGWVRECSRSNIFIVKDGNMSTPASHVLNGVNRRVILRNEPNASEKDITYDELLAADEVFIANSSKRVFPIIWIDGHTIGDGRVGEVTKELMLKYNASLS